MENGSNEVVNAAEAAASSNQVDENLLDDGGVKKTHEHEFESLLTKAIFDMRGEFDSRISHLEEGTTTTRETSALSGSSGSRNESTGRRNSYYVEVGNIEIPSVLAEEEVRVKQGVVPSDSGGVEEFDVKKSRRRRSSCPNHTALEQSTFSLLLSEEVGTIPHTFALRIALVWQYATARYILKRLSLILGVNVLPVSPLLTSTSMRCAIDKSGVDTMNHLEVSRRLLIALECLFDNT